MKASGIPSLLFAIFLLVNTVFITDGFANNVDYQLDEVENLLFNAHVIDAAHLAQRLTPENRQQTARHQRLLGYIYLQQGENELAYKAYSRAIRYAPLPDHFRQDILGSLLSLSIKLDKTAEAVDYGQRYLEEFTPFQAIERLYTRALFRDKQYQKALLQANDLIARFPDTSEFIWQIKALSEERLNLNRALINTINTLQTLFGVDILWQRKQAAAYANLGQEQKAIILLQDAAARGEKLNEIDYLNMTIYAYDMGDPTLALTLIKQHIENKNLSQTHLVNMYQLQYHMQIGQWQQAWQVASLLNDNTEVALLKAKSRIATQLKDWPQALHFAQLAIEMGANDDPLLWEMLGYSALQTKHFSLSRDAYHQLKILDPNSDADAWLDSIEAMIIESNSYPLNQ